MKAVKNAQAHEDALTRSKRTKVILEVFRFLKPHRPQLLIALSASIAAAIATLSIPAWLRFTIDNGLTQENAFSFLNRSFLLLFCLTTALALASGVRSYFTSVIGERLAIELRSAIFQKSVTLDAAFYNVAHIGKLVNLLSSDASEIKSALVTNVIIAVRAGLILLGGGVMMVMTSPKIAAFTLLALPLVLIPLFVAGKHVRKRSKNAHNAVANVIDFATENISAVRTLQSLNHESRTIHGFQEHLDASKDALQKAASLRSCVTTSVIFLVFGGVLITLRYGLLSVAENDITVGELSQFALYMIIAAGSFSQLSETYALTTHAITAMSRILDFLNTSPSVAPPKVPCESFSPYGAIAFHNVSFRYSSSRRNAITDVSLEIAEGETVALIGPSGGGKSTLFQLLLRFYDPSSGEISINNTRIDTLSFHDLRACISYMPQEPVIFAATIEENIRMGKPNATKEEIIRAAKTACAHDFIERLPESYQTKVGERGITLSGGERQRLALARVMLRDAPILLLDEATAALDAENEKDVKAAIASVMKGRTSLIIAHRLGTIQKADRIIVIDNGRIIEEGTSETLLAANGHYARNAAIQLEN